MKITSLLATILTLFTFSICADDLTVGDAAPKLAPSKWIKGQPVKEFEKDKVYVVEFWASWCGPCKESIPHLTEIQSKYFEKNLVVIGQNVLENEADAGVKFMEKMGDEMNYRVALDDDKNTMSKTWLDAAGQDGIPTAFIIEQSGKIAWIGHPLDPKFDATLETVLSGKFDIAKASQKAKNAWLPDLKLADPAPKLDPAKWVKGEPVKEFEKGKTYIVEFFCSWSDICVKTVPVLTDLQKKYADKNLVVIAQSIAERDPASIPSMLEKMGDKIGFRVAIDKTETVDSKVIETWMEAARQDGIPTAFIINPQGQVAFIGNPLEKEFGVAIDEVMAGKYDLKKVADAQMKDLEKARDAKKIDRIIRPLVQEGKLDELAAKIDDIIKTYPNLKAELFALKYTLLIEKGDLESAKKMNDELFEQIRDDVNALAGLAARLSNPQTQKRDLDFALKCALRANEITESNQAEIVDLIATVYFEKGDFEKAIEKETLAALMADIPEQKAYYKEKLKAYQEKSDKK